MPIGKLYTFTKTKLVPRVCAHCGKPGSTLAYRLFKKDGIPFRNYYHLKCVEIVKKKLDEA